ISDKVIFLGFVKNPYKYIKNADIFILSSRWEGFGHVIVESMAAGTPVIATNCKSGPSEIILDNQFGKLVPVGDFIAISEQAISLLENKDKLLELKQAGLHRATSFNAQDIVGEYEKIILNVMDS